MFCTPRRHCLFIKNIIQVLRIKATLARNNFFHKNCWHKWLIAVKESTCNAFRTIKKFSRLWSTNNIRHEQKVTNENILHNITLVSWNYPKIQVQCYYFMTYKVHGFNAYQNSSWWMVHCKIKLQFLVTWFVMAKLRWSVQRV